MSGASVDELRYMERKGFVSPAKARLKKREVRQYQEADVRKVRLVTKYRRQGFTWDVAFKKAAQELVNPTLFEDSNTSVPQPNMETRLRR